jgi:hypothetical protein
VIVFYPGPVSLPRCCNAWWFESDDRPAFLHYNAIHRPSIYLSVLRYIHWDIFNHRPGRDERWKIRRDCVLSWTIFPLLNKVEHADFDQKIHHCFPTMHILYIHVYVILFCNIFKVLPNILQMAGLKKNRMEFHPGPFSELYGWSNACWFRTKFRPIFLHYNLHHLLCICMLVFTYIQGPKKSADDVWDGK